MESVRTLTAGAVLITIQCETLALCYIAWSVGMLQSKLEGVQIPRISCQLLLEEQILPAVHVEAHLLGLREESLGKVSRSLWNYCERARVRPAHNVEVSISPVE